MVLLKKLKSSAQLTNSNVPKMYPTRSTFLSLLFVNIIRKWMTNGMIIIAPQRANLYHLRARFISSLRISTKVLPKSYTAVQKQIKAKNRFSASFLRRKYSQRKKIPIETEIQPMANVRAMEFTFYQVWQNVLSMDFTYSMRREIIINPKDDATSSALWLQYDPTTEPNKWINVILISTNHKGRCKKPGYFSLGIYENQGSISSNF